MLNMPFDPLPAEADPVVAAYHARRVRALDVLVGVLERHVDAPVLAQARAALALFHALPRAGQLEALLDPWLHEWWFWLSQALQERKRERIQERLGQMGRAFVVPALRWLEHLPATQVVVSAGGELRLPGALLHMRTPFPAGTRVRLTTDGELLVTEAEGTSTPAPTLSLPWRELLGRTSDDARLVARPGIEATRLEVDGSDPWIAAFLAHLNITDPPAGESVGDAVTVDPSPLFLSRVGAAVRALEAHWPEMYRELLDNVRLIVPFRSRFKLSFTNTAMLGAIYLNHDIEDVPTLLDFIVHETSHLRLNMYMEVEKVHEHSQEERVRSPFRAGPRPVNGLYHGVFVFARVAEALQRLSRATAVAGYGARLGDTLPKLRDGLDEVAANVRLTAAGRDLFTAIRQRHDAVATWWSDAGQR